MFKSNRGSSKNIIIGLVGLILVVSLFSGTTKLPNIDDDLNNNVASGELNNGIFENEDKNNENVVIEDDEKFEDISEIKDSELPGSNGVESGIEYDYKNEIKNLEVPAYSSKAYAVVNNNEPFFNDSDLTMSSYEKYSNLDYLGRCGYAIASVGKDIMPTEERGNIGMVKPTGWHSVRYQGIDGNYLYNRCHLLGFQLTGENANEKNLITGTRYMNVQGMLPFENMVADYVKETNNHVLLRVTPIFEGANLLASGVLMEAKSVEDDGDGVLFNVYCYNVQPNVIINYATGESTGPEYAGSSSNQSTTNNQVQGAEQQNQKTEENVQASTQTPVQSENKMEAYILNINTKKFHYPSCSSVKQMSEKNKREFSGTRDEVISEGYKSCGNCNP